MRKNRVLRDGASYHVVARVNRQEFILKTGVVKRLFISVLTEAKKRYSFCVKNYCVMSNHIHLLIKPDKGESLSRIMQWILSVFAVRYNKLHKIHGHVWYDRFKSSVIGNFQQFIHAFQYISDNPVKAGIVSIPQEYQYSGISHIVSTNYGIVDAPDVSTAFGILVAHRWLPLISLKPCSAA